MMAVPRTGTFSLGVTAEVAFEFGLEGWIGFAVKAVEWRGAYFR